MASQDSPLTRGEPLLPDLPEVPVSRAVALAAAHGATVKAFDASETAFVLIAHGDGKVDLTCQISARDLAATLRSIADQVDRQAALEDRHDPEVDGEDG